MMRGDAAVPFAIAVMAPLPQHHLVAPITQQGRYDGRTTSLRMMQQLLRKNTRRQKQQEYHQSKNNAITPPKM